MAVESVERSRLVTGYLLRTLQEHIKTTKPDKKRCFLAKKDDPVTWQAKIY